MTPREPSSDLSAGRRLLRAHPTIVGETQRLVMRLVGEAERTYGELDLRLEGGTALAAYHLHHRESEDLDFFGSPGMDARDFGNHVRRTLEAHRFSAQQVGPANPALFELLVTRDESTVAAGVRLQLARMSPFRLEPPDTAAEGVRVASYRDLCAGKLHALCDRFEPRDFIDLHAIVTRGEPSATDPGDVARARLRDHVQDLLRSDPGLTVARVGEAVARGLGRPLVSRFPLRLLWRITDDDVRTTVELCLDELGRLARETWHGDA